MLVRFAVQNYLSFNERTEFNMLTGSPRRLPHHVYHHGDLELLKMAAIYGANGAGKSNFIHALVDLKHLAQKGIMVLNSRKFKLNAISTELPISFEIEFIVEEKMFLYILIVNNSIIESEKLSLTNPNGMEDLIFERLFLDNKIKIDFNEIYKKNETDKLRIKLYEEELLSNDETLLSKLNDSREGFEIVKQAFKWFFQLNSLYPSITISNLILTMPDIHNFVKDYIAKFDTGIKDFEVLTFSLDQFFGTNNQQLKDKLKEELKTKNPIDLSNFTNGKENVKSKTIVTIEKGEYVVKTLVTYHFNNKKEKIAFTPNEESDGTVRIWDLLSALYFVLKQPCLILIDEIDSSVHPALLKELIIKFSENKETKGQLIFTTHESNLLDQEIFRQDEIWFAEKNDNGATELFPMSDFNIRYDLDIRKGYLNGRFGAIPFLSNFKNLNWKAHAE